MHHKSCLIGLLCITSILAGGCKHDPPQQFTDVAAGSGIIFTNTITETESQNIFTYEYMYNGAGVAIGDLNNDGWPEVFFTANQLPNQLYLNKGNLTFTDITAVAGAAGKSGWKTGISMADVNADGLLDIYLCYSGKGEPEARSNQLLINKGIQDGIPHFADEAKQYGLDAPGTNSTQALFFDYDRDNDLDMFLLNHATMFYSPVVNTYKLRHKRHPWFSNYLFRNDGGHFTDVSASSGIAGGGNNFGLGVAAADINNDGWPDLYMTNDYEEQDFLLLNNRDGSFKEVTATALQHISRNGMGCDVADYNNDGQMDIVVSDMWPEDNYRQKVLRGPDEYDKYQLLIDSGYMHQNMRNTLQLQNGANKAGVPQFSEIGQLAGISNTDWSWAALFADFDNDGNKDLYFTNGFLRDFADMDFQTYQVEAYRKQYGMNAPLYQLINAIPQTRLSNYLFRNKADLLFENVTASWGLQTANVSNGVAYADLDLDGDLDLVVNNMGTSASVYRNNNLTRGNYLAVAFTGAAGNTKAVGARVEITTGSGRHQVLEQQPVRGYLSCVSPVLHFGLGNDSLVTAMTIRWPGGKQTILKNVRANQLLSVNENKSPQQVPLATTPGDSFIDEVSSESGIDFYQPENAYVDFKDEGLLPWQLSKQGPKMARADVNGDKLEDLFIGAPAGGVPRLYLQQINGTFRSLAGQPWDHQNQADNGPAVFLDVDGDNDADLLVSHGGNEHPVGASLQPRLFLNDGKGNFTQAVNALPTIATSAGCLAVADYNRDGKPDLFIGGRTVKGKYGYSPPSYLLQNNSTTGNIKWEDVTATVAPGLQSAGMITSAAWCDLNKDNRPDLMIAGEWMPVKVFINSPQRLEERTTEYGLATSHGLWTCIVPLDIDKDGDEDFLLGNLAPNTQLRATVDEPMTLHVGDYAQAGKTAPILCYYIQGKSYPYPSRIELLEELPALKKRFFYFKDYAAAGFTDLFSKEQQAGQQVLKVHHLKNCWLENSGSGKLHLRELPTAAQFSPINGAVVTSLAAGEQAIFAAGNFYPFRVQLGREDAGKGLLLRWDQQRHEFDPMPLPAGVLADGDVRDLTTVRTSNHQQLIIITKNNDRVQVLRNSAAGLKDTTRFLALQKPKKKRS